MLSLRSPLSVNKRLIEREAAPWPTQLAHRRIMLRASHLYYEKVIGVDFEALRSTRRWHRVCCGPEKARVIRGALRCEYVNMLITDLATVRALAELTP